MPRLSPFALPEFARLITDLVNRLGAHAVAQECGISARHVEMYVEGTSAPMKSVQRLMIEKLRKL